MLKFKSRTSSRFKKEYSKMIKRGRSPQKLQEVAALILSGEALPEKLHDHKLIGNFNGCRECHIESDWLLIYRILEDEIVFERTGTHSDLFKK